MDEAKWEQLVARWEKRDRRWEERDRRWEERDRRWEERSRRWEAETKEHREFMKEMWRRTEAMDLRQQAAHEHMIGRLDALTEAVLRVVDRLDGQSGAATA